MTIQDIGTTLIVGEVVDTTHRPATASKTAKTKVAIRPRRPEHRFNVRLLRRGYRTMNHDEVSVTAFHELAESAAQLCTGQRVIVAGRLQRYEGQRLAIIAEQIGVDIHPATAVAEVAS